MLPLVGRGQLVEAKRHAAAREVRIGDESVEAMTVPVGAQE